MIGTTISHYKILEKSRHDKSRDVDPRSAISGTGLGEVRLSNKVGGQDLVQPQFLHKEGL